MDTIIRGARRFDFTDLPVEAGDVYLMRYRRNNGELVFNDVDDKAVAHQIIDGTIPGKVVAQDDRILNRITGPARPEVLALPGFFSADTLRFRRDTDADADAESEADAAAP